MLQTKERQNSIQRYLYLQLLSNRVFCLKRVINLFNFNVFSNSFLNEMAINGVFFAYFTDEI
jgi:hypothetical protein